MVQLNTVFYEPSFSEIVTQSLTVQHGDQKNSSGEPTFCLSFSSSIPPATLSSFDIESELKSCGFSNLDRTIFIDRNFHSPEELFNWSVVLYEVYDDEYFYHCKFFYHLLASAFSVQNNQALKESKDRETLNFYFSKNDTGEKLDKVIDLLSESIEMNKIS